MAQFNEWTVSTLSGNTVISAFTYLGGKKGWIKTEQKPELISVLCFHAGEQLQESKGLKDDATVAISFRQLSITEYLKSEDKEESITLYSYLVMVQESVTESESVCAVGECVVDGALQDERRSLMKDKQCQVLILSLHNTAIRPENIKPKRKGSCMNKSTSDITIYYYKSNMLDDLGNGVPVVLNISNSNQFLKCTSKQDKAVLSVECFEKERLNLIYKNDPLMWPFVFYLSRTKDDCRHFESAECRGWFIRTQSDLVCMDKDTDKDSEDKSYFLISSPNARRSE